MSYPILIALVAGIPFLILVLIRPNIATVVVVFLIYTNLPVNLKKSLDLPEVLVGSFILILIVPLTFYLVIRREKVVIDAGFVLMNILLLISVISAIFFAVDLTVALTWIMTFVLEGMLLYFLIINVVRDARVLNQVIWTLLLACSLLGSLSLLQDMTRSYDNTYYSLAQRGLEIEDPDELAERVKQSRFQRSEVGKVRSTDRAGGPLGQANRYAQIMIVILPLSLFLILGGGSRLRKVLAASAGLLILCGILLSFSRGAFVSLVLLFLVLVFMGTVRLRQTINFTLVLLLLMVFAAPGYLARLATIGDVEGIVSENVEAKGAIAGRTTEMLAALNVFRDHPLLGVGPGQYAKFYSVEYQTDPAIAYRYITGTRRAHSLYVELPAELGLLGFAAFMAIALVILHQLWQLRSLALQCYPEIANISSAFFVGIIAYFMTAIFLHLSYQRYYWFLLAVAGAAIQIFRRELTKETGMDKEVRKGGRRNSGSGARKRI